MYAQMDSPRSITTDMSIPCRAHSAERSRNTIRADVRYAPRRASMLRPSRNSPAPRVAMRARESSLRAGRSVPGRRMSCSNAVRTPWERLRPYLPSRASA